MKLRRSLAGLAACRALLLVLLLAAALPSSYASLCSIYKLPSKCELMYTDAGGCRWDNDANLCVQDTNKPLPVGTVAIALVELDPDSVPLELKPGPSSSIGSISLREGLPVGPSSNITAAEGAASPAEEEDAQIAPTNGMQLRAVTTDTIITSDDTSSETQVPQNGLFCSMETEVGTCRAAIPRWYWDAASSSCKPFIYGGCEGNENNFVTSEACSTSAQRWCGAAASDDIVAYSAAGILTSGSALMLSLASMVLLLCLG